MLTIHLFLLSLLPSLALAQSGCGPSAANDRLASGSYQLALSSSRLHCFSVPLDPSLAGAQVAAGIAGIANYMTDPAGIDYSLRASLAPVQLGFVLIVGNASWVSVMVSYLVSARPDLTLGASLSSGFVSCNSSSSSQSYPLVFSVNRAQPGTVPVSTLILLSGLRTSSGLALQFSSPQYDQTSRQINTSLTTNASREIQIQLI